MKHSFVLVVVLLTIVGGTRSQDDKALKFGEGFIIPNGAWIISDNGNYGYFQQIIFNEDFSVDNTRYKLGFVDLTSDTIEPRILEIHAPFILPESSVYTTNTVNSIEMSSTEEFLAVHNNRGVTVYTIPNFQMYRHLESEEADRSNKINGLRWSKDGRYLAFTGILGLSVWDMQTDLIFRNLEVSQGPIEAFDGGWIIHYLLKHSTPTPAFSSCDLLLDNCLEYSPNVLLDSFVPESHTRVLVADDGNTLVTRVKQAEDQWVDWLWYRQDNNTWKPAKQALPEVYSYEYDPQVIGQDDLTTTVCNTPNKSEDLDRRCKLALSDTQLPDRCNVPLFLSQNYFICRQWQSVSIHQIDLSTKIDTFDIETAPEFAHLFRINSDTDYDQYYSLRINGSGNFLSLALKNRVAPFDLITLVIPIKYEESNN